jgi:hypothetical protein
MCSKFVTKSRVEVRRFKGTSRGRLVKSGEENKQKQQTKTTTTTTAQRRTLWCVAAVCASKRGCILHMQTPSTLQTKSKWGKGNCGLLLSCKPLWNTLCTHVIPRTALFFCKQRIVYQRLLSSPFSFYYLNHFLMYLFLHYHSNIVLVLLFTG